MSKPCKVKVLEQCKVSPPPNSTLTGSIPLTFFDYPWLFFSPGQPLFFYEFPFTTSHFTNTTLPKLKHSLSLTLQHYYPFAANFHSPPESGKPRLVFTDFNFISLTIVESSGDFHHISSNYARNVCDFHPFVPKFSSKFSYANQELFPLLAIQITLFPNAGICMGLSHHHVLGDGRTFDNFLKTWASYCKLEASSFPLKLLPFYDKGAIVDAHGLEEVFLKEWRRRKLQNGIVIGREAIVDFSSLIRVTLVMSPTEMVNIQNWIIAKCEKKKQPQPLHLSPYVLTCAFLWVSFLKAQQIVNQEVLNEDPIYFGFVAGGISRVDYPVPVTYLGNCVGFGRAAASRSELLGEDGIVAAARAIGSTIKKLDKSIFDGAEKWISDWEMLHGSELHLVVNGSPKVNLYGTDFGWGRPKKIEEISIHSTRAISLNESRDVKGGMEIGLALPKKKMVTFTSLFTQGLNALS